MPQGTAANRPDHGDADAARSAVMAALGQSEDPVEDDEAGDTTATSTAADNVEDSDESAANPEEAEEGAESDDSEPAEEIETKGIEEDSPFSAADKAAIAADPKLAKLAKGLQKSYTARMQELGEVRKFREQLKGDPKTVLQRIAESNGLKVRFDEGSAPAPAPTVPAAVPETISAVAAGVRAKWVPIIGEEATDQLLSGMQEIVTAATGAAVNPLLQANTERERAAVQERVNADLDRFKSEHPDWTAHEAAMTELGGKIGTPAGMSTYEYAKFLYDNVTRGKQIAKAQADAASKVAVKVKRAASEAEPPPRTRIPGKGVKDVPKVYKSPEDAVRASLAEMGFSA